MKKFERSRQGGFTLIELVIVVVLIGILSAVAIPKYVEFRNDAATAASKGMAGALASASAINYAAWKVKGEPTTGSFTLKDCAGVAGLLTSTPPGNFTVGGTGTACTVANSDGYSTPTENWTLSRD